jgi:enoyl-CoA hydratase/carnithine racemase
VKSYETLEVEERGPVTWVWLARPERRNALNARALEEIEDCFSGLATRFATRVAVLAGRGPSFCAGADRRDPPGARMAASSGASPREQRHVAQLGLRAARAVERCEALTVARIHGHAIGGGFALAVACDFRVAARDAALSVPEVDLGIPLTWGATPRLVQEIGAARARELILLCDRIDGAQAEAWGVVHRAVAPDRLDAEVEALASRLAAKPEAAVHMTKTQFRAYAAASLLGDVTEADGDLLAAASRSPAARTSFERGRS